MLERARSWLAAAVAPAPPETEPQAQNNASGMRSGTSSGAEVIHGHYEYEYLDQFRGEAKWDTIQEMEADAHVKGAYREATLPLLTAEWEYQPASDSARDKEIAEFCNAVLLGIGSDRYGPEYFTQTPWKSQRLPEILRMLPDGRAVFVSTRKTVGGKWIHGRLQWIEPRTQDQSSMPWVFDEYDNIKAIKRSFIRSDGEWVTDETIPANRLHLFTHEMIGARYDGRSYFRSMFPGWFQKDFIAKRELLWVQKVGSPTPVGSYPSEGYGDDDIRRFGEAVMASRGTSPDKGFFFGPKGSKGEKPEIDYPGIDAQIDKMSPLIRSKNEEINHAGSTSSAMLGETQSGSRSLGQTKGAKEVKHHEAIIELIQIFDRHGCGNLKGPMQTLVDWNWSGVREYPKLVATGYDPYEEIGNQEALTTGWASGIVPHVPTVRKQFCERIGLELEEDDYEIDPTPVGPLPQGTPQPGAGAGQDDSGDGDANPSEDPAKPGTNSSRKKEDVSGGGRVAASLSASEFKAQIAAMLEPYDG